VDQISGTTHTDAQAPPQQQELPADTGTPPESLGFHSRGRARRRARFLRKARELAYRDLGGLVFNLHRFGQRNDALVLAKLTTLEQIDGELRAIESTLGERQSITVLREAGITACPRCAAIHGSEDSFCPNCGLSMGRHPDLPIASAPAAQVPPSVAPGDAPGGSAQQPATPTLTPAPAPMPAPVPAVTPAPASASAAPTATAEEQAPSAADSADGSGSAAQQKTPAPSDQSGRSPSPPSAAKPRSTASPVPATPTPAVEDDATVIRKGTAAAEDGPTEILRPRAPGS
jgi:hypothetical protein